LKNARRITAGAFLALAVSSPVAAQTDQKTTGRIVIASETDVGLRVPPGDRLVFKGVLSFDDAGGHTGPMMLYPGGVAGLVAGVLTHGTLESSARQREKDRIQAAADKVLGPYAEVLGRYKPRELMQRAASRMTIGGRKNLIDADTKPSSGTMVESSPVFFLTQDQLAIVLENDVLISGSASAEPAYRNGIRVVSAPKEAANPSESWLGNNGENLKQTSAQLMSESLEIAIQDASAAYSKSSHAPYRTVRYAEGKLEKMERAQILSATCDRLLLRTLRESLVSVPIKKDDTLRPSSCNSSAR
jgi:hypothetical protein